MNEKWEAINNLITIGLNNKNGLEWEMLVGLYADEKRDMHRGGYIGSFVDGKFIPSKVSDGYEYKCIWTTNGNVIFFRREVKI